MDNIKISGKNQIFLMRYVIVDRDENKDIPYKMRSKWNFLIWKRVNDLEEQLKKIKSDWKSILYTTSWKLQILDMTIEEIENFIKENKEELNSLNKIKESLAYENKKVF